MFTCVCLCLIACLFVYLCVSVCVCTLYMLNHGQLLKNYKCFQSLDNWNAIHRLTKTRVCRETLQIRMTEYEGHKSNKKSWEE